MFCKSSPSEPVADLQYQCLNFSSNNLKDGLHKWPGFSFIWNVCRPKSRGEITLRDAEGKTPPRIFANYLSDPYDIRVMVAGYRIGQQIAATEPFRSLITEQVRPDRGLTSDAEIVSYIRKMGSTVFHPCGTCRMGEDERAVVDSNLRVRGLDGLAGGGCVGDAGNPVTEHSSGDHHDRGEGVRHHRPRAGELSLASVVVQKFAPTWPRVRRANF